MTNQIRQADFIATLKYRLPQEGGRSVPAASGYRPAVKFDFDEMMTSGEQTLIDKDIVFPGESVEAEIRIFGAYYFKNRLTEGMEFDFREGSRIIGTGIINKIINKDLIKSD